jgi:serine/threonine protein kinase
LGKKEAALLEAGCYQRGTIIQTREYRAPEIILGMDFTCQTDMWSFACVAYELVVGSLLFDPKVHPDATSEERIDTLHLQEIFGLIGRPPEGYLTPENGVFVSRFARQGKFLFSTEAAVASPTNPRGGTAEVAVPHHSKRQHLWTAVTERLGPKRGELFFQFLMECLRWRPEDRITAEELKRHPWLASHR